MRLELEEVVMVRDVELQTIETMSAASDHSVEISTGTITVTAHGLPLIEEIRFTVHRDEIHDAPIDAKFRITIKQI